MFVRILSKSIKIERKFIVFIDYATVFIKLKISKLLLETFSCLFIYIWNK